MCVCEREYVRVVVVVGGGSATNTEQLCVILAPWVVGWVAAVAGRVG